MLPAVIDRCYYVVIAPLLEYALANFVLQDQDRRRGNGNELLEPGKTSDAINHLSSGPRLSCIDFTLLRDSGIDCLGTGAPVIPK